MTTIIRETITTAGRIPADIVAGSTLRIDGRGWLEVIARTQTEIEVLPVGSLRAAMLEFGHALEAFLIAAGWYRLLDWLEDVLMLRRRKP